MSLLASNHPNVTRRIKTSKFIGRIKPMSPNASTTLVSHNATSCPWQALDDAGIDWRGPGLEALDLARCGILIGTAMGGMTTFAAAVSDLTLKVTG